MAACLFRSFSGISGLLLKNTAFKPIPVLGLPVKSQPVREFSLAQKHRLNGIPESSCVPMSVLERSRAESCSQFQPCRGKKMYPIPRFLIKHSKETGTMETMKEVPERFFRLNHGLWIRPRIGRDKELWKKNSHELYRLKDHVFCNPRQCRMLDKMVSPYYKRPHYFIDDMYEPYQKRHDIFVWNRFKKPARW